MQVNQAPNNYCSLPKICRVRYARELSHLMEKYYEKTRHYTTKTAPGKPSPAVKQTILPYKLFFYIINKVLTTLLIEVFLYQTQKNLPGF